MKKLILLVALALTAAPALAGTPLTDTRQIMAGTVTKNGTAYKNYLSGKSDGTAAFKGALAVVTQLYYPNQPPPPPPVVTPLAVGNMVKLTSALPQCLLGMSIIPKQGVFYRIIAFGDTVPTPTRQFAELGPFEGATYWVYTDCLTK